jgi:putative glycosyltransferase
MKILLLDVNYKSGSTGKIVYDLKQELEKEGHEVLACYGRGKKVEEKSVMKFAYDFETLIHAFLSRLTGLMGYFSYFSTRRLIKEIEKFEPDVVHIHETHSYFMNHLPLIEYLKKKNIKTVWTFHCEYMYTGNCGHAYDCNKWKNICENCPNIKRYPKSLFFDFTHKMFLDKKKAFENFNNLTIVTPSKWLKDRVEKSFLKNKRVEVIHNGINIDIFKPKDFTHLITKHNIKNKKVILSVAPDIMSKEKGGEWIVKLAEQCTNLEYIFILIGVKDLNKKFPNNVIALGRTENQIELAEYYSLADIFLICSERENFPTTCLEATCCGTPIIGFDEGGTKETGLPEKSFFVSYGDLKELKNQLEKFLNDQESLYDGISQEGIKRYSKNEMFKNYLKIYFD